VAFAAPSIADQTPTPLVALAAALIGLSSEPLRRKRAKSRWSGRAGPREMAVAKDYPTVENTS
jgi:hypothetical protein